MAGKLVHFAIRDDDTCYFTRPADLESCYGQIWDICPISLSVVPFHACTYTGALPEEHWTGGEVFPLEKNGELVAFLRDGISQGRIHVTLHGYHHRDERDGYEFIAGEDLGWKVSEGKRHLEDLLGQPISVFVPPHNSCGREGYRAVVGAGLDISGIQPFRPSFRGWKPSVLALGVKERLWFRKNGFRRPWPLVFPDGHRELPYHPLTPQVSAKTLIEAFEQVRARGGIFCLATHYWEFDVAGQGHAYTIREAFSQFWDKVLTYRDQIEFLTLAELCEVSDRGNEVFAGRFPAGH